MLTQEEKKRLEELRIKELLTEPEKAELADLEKREPEDPSQAEFDAAWDSDDFGDGGQENDPNNQKKTEEEKDQENLDQDQTGEESQSDEGDQETDTLLTGAPAGESDQQASTEGEEGSQETPEQKIARLEAELAKSNQVAASWKGRLQAEQRKHSQANDMGKGVSDDSTSPENEEDDPELSEFFKEFPDLKNPIMKVAEKVATKLVESKIGNVVETVGAVQETLAEESLVKHIAAITKAHSDWEQIYSSGALETWIKAQPKFLQPRLYEIIHEGETDEVIEMFDSYKKAAGKNKSSNNQSTSDSLKSTADSKKKKQQAMEAVPAQSSGPIKPLTKPEKDDFDGSWEYWTKEDEKKKK